MCDELFMIFEKLSSPNAGVFFFLFFFFCRLSGSHIQRF